MIIENIKQKTVSVSVLVSVLYYIYLYLNVSRSVMLEYISDCFNDGTPDCQLWNFNIGYDCDRDKEQAKDTG